MKNIVAWTFVGLFLAFAWWIFTQHYHPPSAQHKRVYKDHPNTIALTRPPGGPAYPHLGPDPTIL